MHLRGDVGSRAFPSINISFYEALEQTFTGFCHGHGTSQRPGSPDYRWLSFNGTLRRPILRGPPSNERSPFFPFFFFLPTLTRQKSCSKDDDDDDDDDTAVEERVSFLARKEQDSLLYGKRENGDSGT